MTSSSVQGGGAGMPTRALRAAAAGAGGPIASAGSVAAWVTCANPADKPELAGIVWPPDAATGSSGWSLFIIFLV